MSKKNTFTELPLGKNNEEKLFRHNECKVGSANWLIYKGKQKSI